MTLLPHDASREGHRIDWLLHSTAILVAIVFAACLVWMLLALFSRRREAVHETGDTRRAMFGVAAISAAIFIVVDGNLFVTSTVDLARAFWNFDAVEPGALKVQVDAHQWAWEFRYPAADCLDAPANEEGGGQACADDVYATDELVVPVGRPVVLEVAATDVIHSFFVPSFRLKIDAVPGHVNRLWFEVTEPGEYEIACAQHCGVGHYQMRGVVRALTADDYARWEARARADAHMLYSPKDTRFHWGWPWREAHARP